ncbi:hypothetical protein B9Z55_007926 [Caenorhabditis nigoni]|nr:hypothetical protein B9Z55_007926 [Caenorhabditis nigoni]
MFPDISLENPLKMSAGKKNKFVIKEIFENVKAGKEKIGKPEERFGILWKIKLTTKSYWCGALSLQLVCSKPEISENEWSIDTDIVTKIGENKKRTFSKSHTFTQGNMSFYKDVFIDYHEMDKFMTDDNVFVEINVTIKKSIGVDLLPKKLKLFDDDVAKNFSDVVLMVGDQEFHVNKMYLASHSTYFETLFLGNFAESEKSIIELKDIDPDEFQNFLEVLYGESPINDDTVAGILKLADMYDAKTAIRRCEEFLAWYSKSTIKEKFEIAAKYKLNELTKCISEM